MFGLIRGISGFSFRTFYSLAVGLALVAIAPRVVSAQPNFAFAISGFQGQCRAEMDARDQVEGGFGVLSIGIEFTAGHGAQASRFDGFRSYFEGPDSRRAPLTNASTIDLFVGQLRFNAHPDPDAEYDLEEDEDGTDHEQNSTGALHTPADNVCLQYLFAGGWPGAGGILDTNWPHFAKVDLDGQPAPGSYIDGLGSVNSHREGALSLNLVPSIPRRHPGSKYDPQTGWFYDGDEILGDISFYNAEILGKFVPPTADAFSLTGPVSWRPGRGHAGHSADGGKNGNLTRHGMYGPSFVFDGDIAAVHAGSVTNLKLQEFTIESLIRRASPFIASLDGHTEPGRFLWLMPHPGGEGSLVNWGLHITPVPEPGAAAILGSGLTVTCFCCLRRRPK